jgi:hypothetical protein
MVKKVKRTKAKEKVEASVRYDEEYLLSEPVREASPLHYQYW